MRVNAFSLSCGVLCFGLATVAVSQPLPIYDISTVAGNGRFDLNPTAGVSISLRLPSPRSLTVDPSGNIYVGDIYYNRVILLYPDGTYNLFAGNGAERASGDGGAALLAGLPSPAALAFHAGELYVGSGGAIRKVSADGIINTIVTQQVIGATVQAIGFNADGVLHWADSLNRISRLGDDGKAVIVAGAGTAGSEGDGGPATEAKVSGPRGLRFDAEGNLYFADANNNRIRRVRTDGVIESYAGTGAVGRNDGPAATASFSLPGDLEWAADGSLLVADRGNQVVRRIGPNRLVTTATGDIAQQDRPAGPIALALDPSTSSPLMLDLLQARVYRLAPELNRIEVIAGSGPGDAIGDGSPATDASLLSPTDIAVGPDGSVYVSDEIDNKVRRIGPDGIITTFAGNGLLGAAVDGASARSQPVPVPRPLTFDAEGNLYVGTSAQIRKITPDGLMTRFAGTNAAGFAGDGGPATQAVLNFPQGMAFDTNGNLFIADTSNHRVRRVTKDGRISTVAGTGVAGFSGDGGPGINARLNEPFAVCFDPAGSLYILDRSNFRVRRLDTDGVIGAFAGNGGTRIVGDGGPAVQAELGGMLGIAWEGQTGSLILSGFGLRAVASTGVINSIAGTRIAGFSGDGSAALDAQIDTPWGVSAGRDGDIYAVDSRNYRIRKLTPRR